MRICHLLTHTKGNYKGYSRGRRKISADKGFEMQERMTSKENSNIGKQKIKDYNKQ